MEKEMELWREVLAAQQLVADANEKLRKAMTRMDVFLDQVKHKGVEA